MEFKSINPYNGKQVGSYTALTQEVLVEKLKRSQVAFSSWRNVPLEERCNFIKKAGKVLRDNVEEYAQMISLEMGKPISESRSEVNKCAWVCDYYAENASLFMADQDITTDAVKSFVRHDPIGRRVGYHALEFPVLASF